jgi:hypothetical protein
MVQHASSPAFVNSEPDLAGRFWYWHGHSGREYIHSIYPFAACPPLPGAVYVAVRREGDRRVAVATGRFSEFWDVNSDSAGGPRLNDLGADELHVHLLARDPVSAKAVARDIGMAIVEAGSGSGSRPGSAQIPPACAITA